jgi:hypothetical protein
MPWAKWKIPPTKLSLYEEKKSALISMYDSIDISLCPFNFLKTGPNEVGLVLNETKRNIIFVKTRI